MCMLAKIRRMYFRDKMSLREISRRNGISRNTLHRWLRQEESLSVPENGVQRTKF